MADEYTPTEEKVRNGFSMYRLNADNTDTGREEFDRMLAAHDADLTARLAAAEDIIAGAREEHRRGRYRNVHRILSAYRPVAAHPEVESE